MSEEEKMDSSPKGRSTESPKEVNDENSNVNEESLTTNDNPQMKNMEVHHHPHVEKKGFREYFLEFLMIFLAVTLGFIAENIREHFAETKTAHQYLTSYRNDLLQNANSFKHYANIFQNLLPVYDSIVTIFYNRNENNQLRVLSRLILQGQRNAIVTVNTSTYQQMVSSGSMRYLNNQPLLDSIASYNDHVNAMINYNDRIVTAEDNDLQEIGKIEDMHDFWNGEKYDRSGNGINYAPDMHPFSLTNEQRNFIISYNKVYAIQAIVLIRRLQLLLASNASLTNMINKELDQ